MSNSISLGEPLILKYHITSSSDDVVSVYMGRDKHGWLSVSLADMYGHAVQMPTEVTPDRNGIRSDGIRLDGHGENEGYFLVSRRVKPAHVGQYHLTLVAHLTYSAGDGGESESFDQGYVLPLTVTPKDAQKLMADAETLRQTVLQDTNVVERQAAVETLLSMPETEARPAWQSLISDPDLPTGVAADIAKQLVRLNSLGAVDLLGWMHWNAPPQWAANGFDALQYLQELYGAGSPQIKQHIDSLLSQHGERMPTRIIGN